VPPLPGLYSVSSAYPPSGSHSLASSVGYLRVAPTALGTSRFEAGMQTPILSTHFISQKIDVSNASFTMKTVLISKILALWVQSLVISSEARNLLLSSQ
jgi:hypothetical protein